VQKLANDRMLRTAQDRQTELAELLRQREALKAELQGRDIEEALADVEARIAELRESLAQERLAEERAEQARAAAELGVKAQAAYKLLADLRDRLREGCELARSHALDSCGVFSNVRLRELEGWLAHVEAAYPRTAGLRPEPVELRMLADAKNEVRVCEEVLSRDRLGREERERWEKEKRSWEGSVRILQERLSKMGVKHG